MSVVITGIGAVTPLGIGVRATWDAVLRSRNAVAPIQRFDASAFPVTFAAEAPDPGHPEDPSGLPPGALQDLKGRLAFAAASEAIAMAGLTTSGPRVGVCVGSEAARPPLADFAERMADGQLPGPEALARLAPGAPTRLVAAMVGAEGPMSTISTACTSSSQAIGEGLLRIRRGEVDVMIVGGVDVLVDPIMLTGFARLGALSTRNDAPASASRPFDLDRDGFVLGEGAGFMVIESEDHARGRGATMLGRLSGFGCSANAYRITDSPPDGRGARQSMQAALKDAGLTPEDIGYINAHGTSTQMNDASETQGILHAFGDAAQRTPVSSTKSMMGHLVAACGAVEAILCLLATREGVLPPTLNLDRPDPACDLHHVPKDARQQAVRHAMTNAFGFGGSNGTLIVSRMP
ncbi:MAG: beta-ketoacyl-[acyl-carrier-protein] synthase family protein [Myxococcota bacterium]